MGADGGSIPKRCELVRTAKQPERANRDDVLRTHWTTCALSKEPLRSPVVACRFGRLYNREAVLEFLVSKRKSWLGQSFSHIRSLRDIVTLRITPKEDSLGECPLTKRPMNGRFKLVCVFGCGCVFAESVRRELDIDSTQMCPLCSVGIETPDRDIITINGPSSPSQEQTIASVSRRVQTGQIRGLVE